jgi:RecA/RadA recombinase
MPPLKYMEAFCFERIVMTQLKKRKLIKDKTPKVIIKNLHENIAKNSIATGNTLLNLALSDTIDGGYGAGKMVNLIGDSSSGKTILALTMLAEANRNPKFKDYDLIFDDVESALEIDIDSLFGESLAERIIYKKSNTIEDYYGAIYNQIISGIPFIWVLDSFDALTSRDEQRRAAEFGKQESKREGDEDVLDEVEKNKGSWKTEKPKMASEIFRVITGEIKKTDSFVMIISQTRDNLGFGAMFAPKTRSGGKALKFYASWEIWLATGKSHKKMNRSIGADCMVKVTKNKMTGKRREVYFPIYYDYGVDSIESCINFLIDEGHWKKVKGKIASEFSESALGIEELVKLIETDKLENKLNKIVGDVWNNIEEKIKLNRKPKYESLD